MSQRSKHLYEFGTFRLDPGERLLLRDGDVISLTPKAFDLLLTLVEHHGHLLEKEELLKLVWPNTFVEEANLSWNISHVRKALDENGNGQRFIETVPKRGYRFVASVRELGGDNGEQITPGPDSWVTRFSQHKKVLELTLAALVVAVGAVTYLLLLPHQSENNQPPQRPLARVTYDSGLQGEPTWSPDGRRIAYSSDRGGNFNIWMQSVSGGAPIQITKSPAHDWQPDWSPDGSQIVFRSERADGGLFVCPELGGAERRISSFGYRPRWSPNGKQILFFASLLRNSIESPRMYVVAPLDGNPPGEVLTEFMGSQRFPALRGVAWHPDSQRVSVLWIDIDREYEWNFWTVPLSGGQAIKSEIAPEVESSLKEAAIVFDRQPRISFDNCLWAPSGRAVYFEAYSQGVRNLWKVTVDPQTLRWVAGPERLTYGPGLDTDPALSRDGKKLAYTTRTANTRLWVLPFDAATGQLMGAGQPVTKAGTDAFYPGLSPDGKKLAYIAQQTGRADLRQTSLEDGRDTLLLADDGFFRGPQRWSRDGTRLAYVRARRTPAGPTRENSIVILPAGGGDEQVLTSPTAEFVGASAWSGDGQWILGNLNRGTPPRNLICLWPVAAAPLAESQLRVVASDPRYNLYARGFSPDDLWIGFDAIGADKSSRLQGALSTLYIVPASGGEWIRLTEGQYWDNKPSWSPDGRTIYFMSDRTGFFNVWGMRFDPVMGRAVGAPFQVTAFDSPGKMILPFSGAMELMVAADRLVLSIMEVSGSIWALENVDR